MAKSISKPTLTIPQAVFPVPPLVTQVELLNILRLRSHIHALTMELQEANGVVQQKLDNEAAVELGLYIAALVNTQLVIWENGDWERCNKLKSKSWE